MAEGIFAGLSNYTGLISIAKYFFYFLIAVIISGGIVLLFIWIMSQLKSKKIIELNLVNRKIRFMRGVIRNKSGTKMMWVGKIRKYIPAIQEEDTYIKGKKDVILLVKDNNGLHHAARLPSYEEITQWYKSVYGIDVSKKNEEYARIQKDIHLIYGIPNPNEDLQWLTGQIAEAKTEFGGAWWQSPTVMIMGTAALCVFMVIVTLIVSKKM